MATGLRRGRLGNATSTACSVVMSAPAESRHTIDAAALALSTAWSMSTSRAPAGGADDHGAAGDLVMVYRANTHHGGGLAVSWLGMPAESRSLCVEVGAHSTGPSAAITRATVDSSTLGRSWRVTAAKAVVL